MKNSAVAFILFIILTLSLPLIAACGKESRGDGNNAGTTQEKEETEEMNNLICFNIGTIKLEGELENNAATRELVNKLPITVELHDYGGFEKVGGLGFDLPTENREITTDPCDFVLYSGNQLVIFYGSNCWSYTPLGRIKNVTADRLKELLGKGDLSVVITAE